MSRYAAVALLALAVFAPLAEAKKHPFVLEVADDAALFSDGGLTAIRKAGAGVAIPGVDPLRIYLMSVAQMPAEVRKSFDAAEGEERAKVFREWAKTLAKAEHARDLFVVVCENPKRFHLLWSDNLEKAGFGKAEQTAFRNAVEAGLKKAADARKADKPKAEVTQLYDGAILGGVETLRERFPATVEAPAEAENNIGRYLLIGLAVVVGILLISALMRGMSSSAGGGSFFGGFFGGMLGVMGGMWLYNSFFGGDTASSGETGATGGDDVGGDGTGGDFDSGGGDFGGGDMGGDF